MWGDSQPGPAEAGRSRARRRGSCSSGRAPSPVGVTAGQGAGAAGPRPRTGQRRPSGTGDTLGHGSEGPGDIWGTTLPSILRAYLSALSCAERRLLTALYLSGDFRDSGLSAGFLHLSQPAALQGFGSHRSVPALPSQAGFSGGASTPEHTSGTSVAAAGGHRLCGSQQAKGQTSCLCFSHSHKQCHF